MTIKIKCKKTNEEVEPVRVRVIKAPIVNTKDLRSVILARTKALIL